MHNVGVIEGFYGNVWSWQERHDMVHFLAQHQFSSYWYAPKADHNLRKHWYQNWSVSTLSELEILSASCKTQDIQLGIGLSPLGLYDEWRKGAGREKLLHRLQQIALIKPQGLALLFDDMQGDLPELAQTQCDIAHFVADNIDVEQLILCPSYYSFDPILEQLFGAMPKNYWSDLGAILDSSIELFWTGDQVISKEYSKEGLAAITLMFNRKPIIWDNSIVNDGRKTSPFLNVSAMHDVQALEGATNGVLINPMNAQALSQIPLASLLYAGDASERLQKALKQQAPELQAAINDCLSLFTIKGHANLNANDCEKVKSYFAQSSHPIAKNIMLWLNGDYQFDPLCLT
jgi:hypothetical protein